jgi:hypothetical protein
MSKSRWATAIAPITGSDRTTRPFRTPLVNEVPKAFEVPFDPLGDETGDLAGIP